MARTIHVDAVRDAEFVVSDSEFAGIDWGNSSTDVVSFETEDGEIVFLRLGELAAIYVKGGPAPAPGSTPGFRIKSIGGHSGQVDSHVSEATKDTLLAALSGPGSDDIILKFTILEGDFVVLPNKNSLYISFQEEALITPSP